MEEKRNKQGLTEREFLERYKPGDYERPSVTVDMLVLGMSEKLDGLKVLLIQRKDHPFIDCWALPGGFVNMDESTYQAAGRELKEETGLSNVYMEQLYTMSQPNRDPRMRVIDVSYMALIPIVDVEAGDDAKDALWFDILFTENKLTLINHEKNIQIKYAVEKKTFKNGIVNTDGYKTKLLTEEALAFDHNEIVLEGLLRLRNKVEYSDIAFNLLPENFTMPDLQQVYEIILGKDLYKTNFKASIATKLDCINYKIRSVVSGRLAMGYRYRR